MKGMVSLLIVAAISVGAYMMFLKQAAPGAGMAATQAISLTGVQNDLMSIAQAERMYFAQSGTYADLDTLVSSGTMTLSRSGRDGYSYSVQPSANGFVATARHTAPLAAAPAGTAPPRFPTISIDQTMQLRRSD